MRFIVDAQLPRRLATWLNGKGYDTLHTLDLPDQNRSTDGYISEISMREQRIVISKDADFYDRFFEKLEPYKLVFLKTGNLSNDSLIHLFERNLEQIVQEMHQSSVVELSQDTLTAIV